MNHVYCCNRAHLWRSKHDQDDRKQGTKERQWQRRCSVHRAQGMTVMTRGVKFTGHKAQPWHASLNIKCHIQQIIHESKNKVQMSSPWFTTDMTCQLDVLGHNGDMFHMNGHQVHILKQSHEVSFSCLLQCSHCGNLKAEIMLEVGSNFLD